MSRCCAVSRGPPLPRPDQQVVDRVLEIRDDLPEGLGRIPGPRAILYYLGRDGSLKEMGLRLPQHTEPIERPRPMEHWQLDFKDASTVPADPHGKRQHVVETLNIIDKGTSVLVAHHVRSDFTAETARQALAETFSSHGLPASITLDRDTRWVGAPQGSDFPAAQVALLSFPRGCSARLRSASPATKWVCRKISSHTQSGVPFAVSSQNLG